MTFDIFLTICVILIAVILFITEAVSVDLVALLIIATLVLTGVVTPQEGVDGFSNSATITVAFMFVLSAAMLKTGALQYIAHSLSSVFEDNFNKGMLLMMILIAVVSAFINNTPVVAVFIPVIIQIAKSSGQNPKKMLIPLSFASIFGGTCTLIGSSTNMLVSGIAENQGLDPISMFQLLPVGIVFLIVGIIYLLLIGIPLLPQKEEETDLGIKFNVKKFLTEIQLTHKTAPLEEVVRLSQITEKDIDVLEIRRNGKFFSVPDNDFELEVNDVIKIRCDSEKIKKLKRWAKEEKYFSAVIGDTNIEGENSTLLELIILSNSSLIGINLRDADFKGRYRSVPLAVKQHKDILNEDLSNIRLKAGDIILVETKNTFLDKIRRIGDGPHSPFAVLSEEEIISFNKKDFTIVLATVTGIVTTASLGILHIMIGAIVGVSLLILLGIINMKEMYKAIDWQVIFLLAGALCLGTAMSNTGLDQILANGLINNLQQWGPIVMISGVYLLTSILTEFLTNNAVAALLTPIVIVMADSMSLSPVPFIMAIAFAGSASFMTPIGYQTNTMVYSSGKYKFTDFVKTGGFLNLIFWMIATFMIPWVYGF